MRLVFLADPVTDQNAGVHTYTISMVQALKQCNSTLVQPFFFHQQPHPVFQGTEHYLIPDHGRPGETTYRQLYKIPQLINKLKPDLVWQPAQFGPYRINPEIFRITTVHDLTPLTFPHFHPWFGRTLQKLFLKKILTNTNLIVTPSQATLQDLNKTYPNLNTKITSSHLALPAWIQPGITRNTKLLTQLSISKPYILSVGTQEPRKNHQRLINAFAQLPANDYQLVIAGPPGWGTPPTTNHPNVIFTGYLSHEQLNQLYAQATIFCYPSLYEGFGLPVLEAMAHGLPCLVSDRGSLPEVGGDAVVYCNPESEVDIVDNLWTLCQNQQLRADLSSKAQSRAQLFNWSTHLDTVLTTCREQLVKQQIA